MQAAIIYFDWTLQETLKALAEKDVEGLGTFAKIRLALLTRFEVLKPYRDIEKALFRYLLTRPVTSLKFLYQVVDELWRFAGDVSLDYNFYTKRILLGGVYSSSF